MYVLLALVAAGHEQDAGFAAVHEISARVQELLGGARLVLGRPAGSIAGESPDASCRFPSSPFVSWATIPHKEEAMKYMLLIHQGSTPLPGSDEWEWKPT